LGRLSWKKEPKPIVKRGADMNNISEYFKSLKNFDLSLLIVDDSATSRQMMHEILSEYFAHIDSAEDGKEALETFLEKKHDIIITDVVMPGMSGAELVSAIRTQGYMTPIMAVSGSSRKEQFIELINAGVTAFILKPISIELMLSHLYRICKPITDAKSSQKRLDNYASLVDKNVITSTTDLDGNIEQVSEAFCAISKYIKEELIGQNHRIIKHPDMLVGTYQELWNTISADKIWRGEIKNIAKDGVPYWVDATISPIYDDNATKIGYTAIRQDITNKKKIEEMSITDGMTALFNRRYFNEMLPKLLGCAKRDNKYFGFLMIDVDNFKKYNDTYGHLMGDEALIKLAATMKEVFKRGDDVCFRLGGEEFGVIFVSPEPDKAYDVSNKLRESIEAMRIPHTGNGASPYITASMGLVVKKASEITDPDNLYKEVDTLLYVAKDSGRNIVCR
jgi:diguanylate cyclase (GGDEF)-like protein/PAS domain S-box-containing protein